MTLDEINKAPEKDLKEPVRLWSIVKVFFGGTGILALGAVLLVAGENVNRRIATLENRANHYRSENVELAATIEGLRRETDTNFQAQGEAIALAVQIAEEKRIIAPEALVKDIQATLQRARGR
ncbi:MAG: hypothetical protein ACR2QF_15150 [Geminicoccaceae bacterium]